MTFIRFSTVLILSTGLGCAHVVSQKPSVDMENRVQMLSKRIKKQQSQLDRLREENVVLHELAELAGAKGGPNKMSDATLYKEVVRAFRHVEANRLKMLVRLLDNKYPQSLYLDNAYLLLGRLYMKQGKSGDALKVFDQVIKRFPQGNKKPAALLAKGRTFKKLNLSARAKTYLNEVMVDYPGSPEARLAQKELKSFVK